jgi:hypothetical protein
LTRTSKILLVIIIHSFRMSHHMFPDCVGEVDVVAGAENIKRLLKLPYSLISCISMIVHRIGNTLLINEFDIHKYLLRQEDTNWKWLRQILFDNILYSFNEKKSNIFLTNSPTVESSSATQTTSNLLSKFLCPSGLPPVRIWSVKSCLRC